MNTKECTYNFLEDKDAVLISKKRCLIGKTGIMLKKGMNPKNAIIRLKTNVIPKEINSNLYHCTFINKSDLKDLPYYSQL